MATLKIERGSIALANFKGLTDYMLFGILKLKDV